MIADNIDAVDVSKKAYYELCKFNGGRDVNITHGLRLDLLMDTMYSFMQSRMADFKQLSGGFADYCESSKIAGDYLTALHDKVQALTPGWVFDHTRTVETPEGALIGEMASLYINPHLEDEIDVYREYFRCLENDEVRLIVLPPEYSLYYENRAATVLLLYTKSNKDDWFKQFEVDLAKSPIHNAAY